MFTGLVETVGTVSDVSLSGKSAEIRVRSSLSLMALSLGESIAVNGVCLTLTGWGGGCLSFHALSETMNRTNLKRSIGRRVNLERALQLGDRLGGHLVSGHVDARIRVLGIRRVDDDTELTVELPESLAPQVVMKGSVALNGVSLTVAALRDDSFAVRIIPHTWDATNLCDLKPDDDINLETDMLGKYVLRQLEVRQRHDVSSEVTMETLLRAGF